MPAVKGHSVVIIGGSSGIGAAAAKLACVEGLKVAIASSSRSRVDEAIKKIQDEVPGAEISGFTVDISGYDMESHLEKLFTHVTEANGGRIDHIILTAGLANVKPISEFTAEYFREAAPLLDSHQLINSNAPPCTFVNADAGHRKPPRRPRTHRKASPTFP